MSKKRTTPRLDEILISDGLISKEQIKEALEYQRKHGGKIGSHLLRFGYIDEAKLLAALEKQFGCESVQLSDIDIPDLIIKFIPAKVVLARGVVPFDYDPESNTLKIACEDPTDDHLIDELRFIARGKKIRLYVAAEIALKSTIARYYFSPNESPVTETTPGEQTPPALPRGMLTTSPFKEEPATVSDDRKAVLLVTDEPEMDQPIRLSLEQECFEVVMSDSADDAIEVIGSKEFHSVFIRDTVQGDYIDLIDRLRKISPGTKVHYYESPARLLLDDTATADSVDLLVKNLDLLTSMLVSKEKLPDNHAGTVGYYVDRLCRRIRLPDKDRLAITNAAYLHNLARFYYGSTDQPDDERTLIGLTAKLLDSLNYSPLVIGILRSMYIDLGGKYTRRLPIEALGGNIVTLADIFCENMPPNERISLDKFDRLKRMFHDLVGRLFLPEVVEVFLDMLQEEMLTVQDGNRSCQVMIYSEGGDVPVSVQHRLIQEGFRIVIQESTEKFLELFERGHPDILVLLKRGSTKEVISYIDALVERGIDPSQVPTVLLTESPSTSESASILEKGIEDIVPIEDNPDLLVAKLREIYSRIDSAGFRRVSASSGCFGKDTGRYQKVPHS